MKVSDIVVSKKLWKPAGVMGSSLKTYKEFEGFAIIVGIDNKQVRIMLPTGKFIFMKQAYLEVVCASR